MRKLWVIKYERFIVEYGHKSMNSGICIVKKGQITIDNGRW